VAPELLGRAAWITAAETGREVIVAGTQREPDLVARCLDAAPGARSLGLDLSVPEFAALIEASSIVLCGNSSALHFADALDRPVVVAYSGTDLRSQWEPPHTPSAVFTAPVACSPCYLITCPIGNACLDLDPDALAAAALELLRERAPAASDTPVRSARCAA
jgi:ADP-heptose:LPS heptosyltransferase